MRMSGRAIHCWPVILVCLAACEGTHDPEVSPVRVHVQTVEKVPFAPVVSLTGSVQARGRSDLSFRVGGKLVERYVEIGDHVNAGQLLARLDPQEQKNTLLTAEAALLATQSRLKQHQIDYQRQSLLLAKGHTSRSEFDQARAALLSAESALQGAEAQLATAREQLSHTRLITEVGGVVTSRTAEVGQVVQAAAPVFGLALDGPRDAVFHIHETLFNQAVDEVETLEVEVVRFDDPRIRSRGRVREVAPVVSERSGTLQVKVELMDPVEGMQLGSVVTARHAVDVREQILLPGSALSSIGGKAAVWTVTNDKRAKQRLVQVARYSNGLLVLDDGLEPGELVVVKGGQLLYPGQRVEIAEVLETPRPSRSAGKAR